MPIKLNAPQKEAIMTRLDPELAEKIRAMAEVGSRTISRQMERIVRIGMEHCTDELEEAS